MFSDNSEESGRINQMLSVLLSADNVMPVPAHADLTLPGPELGVGEARQPGKHPHPHQETDYSEKRRRLGSAPHGENNKPRHLNPMSVQNSNVPEGSDLPPHSPMSMSAPIPGDNSLYHDDSAHDKYSGHPLHLDDEEENEWFRALFRSSVTPRDPGAPGTSSFADPPAAAALYTGATTVAGSAASAAGAAEEDHFSSSFMFNPASPMFHTSARLTPSRRTAPFFSPDGDINEVSSSPRREYLNRESSNLNREFMFTEEEPIPTYEHRVHELVLPPKRRRKKKKVSTDDKASSAIVINRYRTHDLLTHTEPYSDDKHRNIDQHTNVDGNSNYPQLSHGREPDQNMFSEQAPQAQAQELEEPPAVQLAPLPSIPASLLMAPVHEDAHIQLDPVSSAQPEESGSQASAADLLPTIPRVLLEPHSMLGVLPSSLSPESDSKAAGKHAASQLVGAQLAAPDSVPTQSPDAVLSTPEEARPVVEANIGKPKRKNISMLVAEVISILDIRILSDYFPDKALHYASKKSLREKGDGECNSGPSDSCSRSGSKSVSSTPCSRQPSIDAALRCEEIRQRLSAKDIRDLTTGNLSATSIAKLVGESHHQRLWEICNMLMVLGLLEQTPRRNYLHRCADDSKMITLLALLQNEAIFQLPQDAVRNGIVPADFFNTKSTLLFQLQSSLAPSNSATQLANFVLPTDGDYAHAFYYREVLKIFLCGNKVRVMDIRRMLIAKGCSISQSGERRLYDAIAVMLSVGLIKRHEDPTVYIASVSQRVYTWCFHDLKDIRQQWLQAAI